MARWGIYLILMGLLVAGCSEDDKAPLDPEGSDPYPDPLPETAESLMDTFEDCYIEMDSSRLADLVHEDARVFLLESITEAFANGGHPLGFSHFDHDGVVTAHRHLFTGEEGSGTQGQMVPAIVSVQIDYLDAAGAWEIETGLAEEFPDQEIFSCLYHLLVYFNSQDQHRWEARCDVEFYATEVEREGAAGYQLIGWRDLMPPDKAASTEHITLSHILAIYR